MKTTVTCISLQKEITIKLTRVKNRFLFFYQNDGKYKKSKNDVDVVLLFVVVDDNHNDDDDENENDARL